MSDVSLRRCSPAARGLWMDMLCVAAQAEPFGYLVSRGRVLAVSDVARVAGLGAGEAEGLMDELEIAGVFSRDRKGRIYSRRMVREARLRKAAQQAGRRGGNPSLCSGAGKPSTLKGRVKGEDKAPLPPISQSPESKSQTLSSGGSVRGGPQGLGGEGEGSALARAARLMGVDAARLRRRPGWLIFGDMIAGLQADGCEAERDVWPAIERVAKGMREPPASPLYFRAAILDARDQRRARGGPHAAGLLEWEDRLAVYAAEGAWSSRWGPKPGEAGCLAPQRAGLSVADDGRMHDMDAGNGG